MKPAMRHEERQIAAIYVLSLFIRIPFATRLGFEAWVSDSAALIGPWQSQESYCKFHRELEFNAGAPSSEIGFIGEKLLKYFCGFADLRELAETERLRPAWILRGAQNEGDVGGCGTDDGEDRLGGQISG